MARRRFLLDTHVVAWALSAPHKLSPRTRHIVEREELYVSALTAWEIALKGHRGRPLVPTGRSVIEAVAAAGASWLPLRPEHAEAAAALEGLHGDPVDRMLVATARLESMTLLTRDAQILERAAPLLGPLLQEA